MSDMPEPLLAPDFAARVLREAGRIASRRRRTRRLGVAAAIAGACLAVLLWPASPPNRPLPSQTAGASADRPVEQAMAAQTGNADALDELFPDAKTVMQFDSRYDQDGSETEGLLSESGRE